MEKDLCLKIFSLSIKKYSGGIFLTNVFHRHAINLNILIVEWED